MTAAALVNELVEAEDERELSKVVGRYGRLDLLCLDELGYLHLDRRGAELLFQVLTERDERASIAVATNAPFSEWGQTFTDPRLAGAVVDRLTFRAHILETGAALVPAADQPGEAEGGTASGLISSPIRRSSNRSGVGPVLMITVGPLDVIIPMTNNGLVTRRATLDNVPAIRALLAAHNNNSPVATVDIVRPVRPPFHQPRDRAGNRARR